MQLSKVIPLALFAFATAISIHAQARGCPLPWGGVLVDGDSTIAWNYSAPPFGTHCRSEVRSCEGGFLTGSYSAPHCAEPARFFSLPLKPQLISF